MREPTRPSWMANSPSSAWVSISSTHSAALPLKTTWAMARPPVSTPDPDPSPDPVTYDGAVKAILQANCTNCHRQGLTLGSIALDTYASAFANRVALVDSVEKLRMPLVSPLSPADTATLRDWLDGGAPEK